MRCDRVAVSGASTEQGCPEMHSYRYRLWKTELAALAAETGLAITVCHFPPGTSK